VRCEPEMPRNCSTAKMQKIDANAVTSSGFDTAFTLPRKKFVIQNDFKTDGGSVALNWKIKW
jgi:hypothetical protein